MRRHFNGLTLFRLLLLPTLGRAGCAMVGLVLNRRGFPGDAVTEPSGLPLGAVLAVAVVDHHIQRERRWR